MSEHEATLIKSLKSHPLNNKDHSIAIFRIMNTRTGMLNVARRGIQEVLSKMLGIEVYCVPISGKHRFDGMNQKEETLLLAISNFIGGQELLKDTIKLTKECPAFKLWIGSMELKDTSP